MTRLLLNRRGFFSRLFLGLVGAMWLTTLALAAGSREDIGEVVLSVGPADGLRLPQAAAVSGVQPYRLSRGDKVKVGDRLMTGPGGHLHIRFIDGAFIAVRPDSELLVEEYRYDKDNVGLSTVKFRLTKGAARSITGRAGESVKDRFRLNTPIAAVGIRGTDFVVITDREQSSVVINTGAVVIAPLGQSCSAEALGPCSSPLAQLLSADMSGLYARIEPAGVRLLPIAEVKSKLPHPDEPASLASRLNRFRTVDASQAAYIATPGTLIAGDVNFTLGSSPMQPVSDAFGDARSQQVSEAYAKVVNPGASLPPSSLVWGRWAIEPILGESNPAPVIVNPEYSKMLVSDGVNAIFGPSDARSIVPREGKFDFVLRDARAALMTPSGPTAGLVHSGQLSIDFALGFFSTRLRASHDAIDGMISVEGYGPLHRDGLFQSVNQPATGTNIVGVVANAGKEAVYVFSKPVTTRSGTASNFFGLSRWGR